MHDITRALATTAATFLLAAAGTAAQPTSSSPLADRPNRPRSADPTHHVIYNATIHADPDTVWAPGFVEFKDGVIINAGPIGRRIYVAPEGARAHDLTGEHVYPGLIDAYVEVDAPAPGDKSAGLHWNPKVTPHRDVLAGEGLSESDRERLRKLGFAVAGIAPKGGVFAGLGAVVSTADRASDASEATSSVYAAHAFHALDFETAGWGSRGYPSSHPGAVALMRQTLSDADWQADNDPDAAPNALTPLENTDTPLMFDIAMELEHFLAADIAREFDRTLVTVGNGQEYKWLAGLAREQARNDFAVVVPLRYPKKPDVSTVGRAESVELADMLAWEHAPTNAGKLAQAGVTTALTTTRLPKGQKFMGNLRRAIEHGLTERDALAMLTTTPAEILGVAGTVGSIEQGKAANLLVTSGPLFDEDTEHLDLFVDGARYRLNDREGTDFDGDWTLTVGDPESPAFTMSFTVKNSTEGKLKITVAEGEGEDKAEGDARKPSIQGDRISFLIDDEDDGTGTYIMSAALTTTPDGERLVGTGLNPNGSPFQWLAARAERDTVQPETNDDADETDTPDMPAHPGYPFGPYASAELPEEETFAITNATLWTSGPDGIIENGTLIVAGGEIRYAGPARGASIPRGARVIDGAGKHVTPGLIDAHSHTSLFRMGVNEAGQAVTAEVRIGDSLDPSSINWYRQLAMGVTTVLSLHGSANPIGGQSQTHKVRWGVHHPHDMRMENATPGIKFALGENVKQANWGDDYTTRYPQTRMGVETIMRDRFIAAQEYAEAKNRADRILRNVNIRMDTGPEGQTQVRISSSDLEITRLLEQSGLRSSDGQLATSTEGWSAFLASINPRRDLELETIAEILAGERLIHCHSYRQDEILMLCRIAEDFDFTIGTFQHGLEVYKVAEAVQNHALGASIFSDWWAYKFEVVDAIPQAGPLQAEAGVVTSFNSDSDELARRMNLEAAKATRYSHGFDSGDPAIDAAEALKFVTINPAIQLGIEDRVGSLEQGKDADFVVWSDDPMSVYAMAEATWIDGREYFSLDKDAAHREAIRAERQRLVQKILEAPGTTEDAEGGDNAEEANEDESSEGVDSPPRSSILASYMRAQLRAGRHPENPGPGDCGCGIINHAIFYEHLND
jgi:imidazolonepropionase-like amidohydrolase